MNALIELDEETWFDTFKPLPNLIDPTASFDGYMFETYGSEIEFVKSQDPNTIWTYVDGDDGGLYIVSGWQAVNRIGYFVTTLPFNEEGIYQIQISCPVYECPTCEAEWTDESAKLHFDKFEAIDKCLACATPEELEAINE